MLLDGYALAVKDMPAWAIKSAVEQFVRGEVEGQSLTWCPRPPELRRVVRSLLQPVYREQAELAERDRARAEQASGPSAAERERMRFRSAMLARAYGRGDLASFVTANRTGIEALHDLERRWDEEDARVAAKVEP